MIKNYITDVTTYIKVSHKKNIASGNYGYHLHEFYEIYLLLDGSLNYFVDKTIYSLNAYDLILLNNEEIHTHSSINSNVYERIIIQFNPVFIDSFCLDQFNLLNCFTNRPKGERNKLVLSSLHHAELVSLFFKLETLIHSELPERNVLIISYFVQLLVFINNLFEEQLDSSNPLLIPPDTQFSPKLGELLRYIDTHIDKDLSLDALEHTFYINKFHLSRLFKKTIGIPIHKYIVLKRIIRSKELLVKGFDVTTTCYMCGFSDYSHFIKMFNKIVGISPSKYKKEYHKKTNAP